MRRKINHFVKIEISDYPYHFLGESVSKIENHAGLLVLTCDKMGRRSVGRTKEDAGPLDMISVFVTLCFPSKT